MSDKNSVEGILRQIRAYRAERTFAPALHDQYEMTNTEIETSFPVEEQPQGYRTMVYYGDKFKGNRMVTDVQKPQSEALTTFLLAAPSIIFVVYLLAIATPALQMLLAIGIFATNIINVGNRSLGLVARIFSGIGIAVAVGLFLIAFLAYGVQEIARIYG